MGSQNRRQRRQAVAQAKAVDTAAIAITVGLGVLGLLAGLAALIH